MAAALVAAWAFSGTALAAEPGGFHLSGGWTARLFVAPIAREPVSTFEASPNRATLGVNARLARPLGHRADVAIEAKNLFDREPLEGRGLEPAPAGRGVQVQFRWRF